MPVEQILSDARFREVLREVDGGYLLEPNAELSTEILDPHSLVLNGINSVFNLGGFKQPRLPFSLGLLTEHELAAMLDGHGAESKDTDVPIKFPGSNFRIPSKYRQLIPLISRIANIERRINARCYDEYYCYLTLHQSFVRKGLRQRPSPCHVDGFQGARWPGKVRCNHSYVVCNALPTVFHRQSMSLDHLDDTRHNFFLEMDRQVREAGGINAWSPLPAELLLMDCYCVHHGACALEDVWRVFVRVSFEVRIFDHIDNGRNPMFAYDWPMVDRHIGKLGLETWKPE